MPACSSPGVLAADGPTWYVAFQGLLGVLQFAIGLAGHGGRLPACWRLGSLLIKQVAGSPPGAPTEGVGAGVRSFFSSLPSDLGCVPPSDANRLGIYAAGAQLRALLLRSADAQLNPAGWWISRAG